MTLEEVLPALRKGKKIRRAAWIYGAHVEFKQTTILFFDPEDRVFIFCSFSPRDIIADDWEIIA